MSSSLFWDEFESLAKNTFIDLFNNNNFTDVTLVCEDDKQLNAHKVILSACSSFFKRILLKNQHNNPLIYLNGINFEVLEAIINFIYLGEAQVNNSILDKFLEVGTVLEIYGLTQKDSKSEANMEFFEDPMQTFNETEKEDFLTEKGTESHLEDIKEIYTLEFETETVAKKSPVKISQLETWLNKSHDKLFYCKECSKDFSSRGSLRNHKRAKHEGFMFSCNYCNYRQEL